MLLLFASAPGLDGPPSTETLIILSLGTFLGSVVMGICGFGSAILHLTTWCIAGGLGFDAGPLKLAVITCGCAMTTAMVPLFFLADARQQAVRPLALSIPLFKAVAAPLGALLLKFLPAQQLEAVVAAVILLLMLLMNQQPLAALGRAAGRWLCGSPHAAAPGPQACKSQGSTHLRGAACPAAIRSATEREDQDDSRLPLLQADSTNDEGGSGLLCSSNGGGGDPSLSLCGDSGNEGPPADGVVLVADLVSEAGQPGCAGPRLAHLKVQCASSSHGDLEIGAAAAAAAAQAGPPARAAQPIEARTGDDLLQRHGFWFLFAIGSVAGIFTGLLGGATGISGPPLMLLYAYLDASQAAIRGTNAVVSLVQDQLIGYFVFGLMRWEDCWVYVSACVCGVLGLLLGHRLQAAMGEGHFRRVMSLLMLLCFVLMALSAAGVLSLK